MKYRDQGKLHLDKIFNHMVPLTENFSVQEIAKILAFYKSNEIDLSSIVQHEKPSIPEEHDLKLLVCCNNCGVGKLYLVSDDAHFWAYAEVIEKFYPTRILPMKEVRLTMTSWGWT